MKKTQRDPLIFVYCMLYPHVLLFLYFSTYCSSWTDGAKDVVIPAGECCHTVSFFVTMVTKSK